MDGVSKLEELEDVRDRKIAQLEHALISRIVIEQAKGIIAERFGMEMDASFELLRQAARSHRMKLSDLASELIETRVTPSALVDALARIGHPSVDAFKSRALQTERFFADMNNALLQAHQETEWKTFVCECANPVCTEPIILDPEMLQKIHEYLDHYVIKAGHELPDIETVVDRIDGLVIVEKQT